ncbi:MAG: lipopolysaccharide transport periplasmic protein LptA [Rhodobacteraceae bacterium]|nr:lipopolysaccharide transport periplasmic protein LptA [Paracoccaceae bacterium]
MTGRFGFGAAAVAVALAAAALAGDGARPAAAEGATAGAEGAAAGAEVPFGFRHDASQPVEVSADRLRVSQTDGSATFSGNVVVGQGDMRLSAAEVRVEYATEPAAPGETRGRTRIRRLHATGGVTIVSGAEAAEAREAVYSIDEARVVMTGEVILTQGPNVLAGDRLTVNLADGTALIEGRVRTVLQPGATR